jgi:hypothetical protein
MSAESPPNKNGQNPLNFEIVDAHEITIGIEEVPPGSSSYRFTYKPGERVGVQPGTIVTWKVEEKPRIEKFTLLFDHAATPFSKRMLHSDPDVKIEEEVRSNARPRRYKYTVAALVNGQIYIDDPELIIRE